MPVVNSSECDFNWTASNFRLLSVDNAFYTLNELKGKKGTVIVFICNHCPYVIEIVDKLAYEANELKKIEVNLIAIMSNDVESYPDDSYDNMKKFSIEHKFKFHYLYDVNQEVAKKYGAECTPDFFGFNQRLQLHYRGRIHTLDIKDKKKIIKRDLYEAMKLISDTNKGPIKQFNSFGCSIKWKNNE
ncbi:MAG: hypothetical protein CFH16_01133 [Alphaproteobacteria bacterium MarineAlpha5_Bin6]|nr:MAG: hypothetical protein CFH17_00237 [Alphaproteobacteria bacterium MarineAlpha5_Bin7]PPR53195.1 MAG: hypothetical protein CFH16_01133 [Alphaproteobacteria bacterium MarineAlpha5_Bin6]|tara:strand:+ start:51 stop:611 length:561 start_codon:yes stop_codon:yes gene_type:complete